MLAPRTPAEHPSYSSEIPPRPPTSYRRREDDSPPTVDPASSEAFSVPRPPPRRRCSDSNFPLVSASGQRREPNDRSYPDEEKKTDSGVRSEAPSGNYPDYPSSKPLITILSNTRVKGGRRSAEVEMNVEVEVEEKSGKISSNPEDVRMYVKTDVKMDVTQKDEKTDVKANDSRKDASGSKDDDDDMPPCDGGESVGGEGKDPITEAPAVDDIQISPIPFQQGGEDPTTLMELPENILCLPISPCGPNDK